jgi:hypothetical protein
VAGTASQWEQNLRFYLNVLEKLIKDEYMRNGLVYLNHLVGDKHFLRSVASLSLEVACSLTTDRRLYTR